jgi:FKBP-type peptidyl-prolyl cis-trans isomerase
MRRFLVSIAVIASLVLVVACGGNEEKTTTPSVTANATPSVTANATPSVTANATAAQTGGGPPPVSAEATVTASGLKIMETKIGTGDEAQKGKTVSVHYTGWLADGTKFDSSLDRGQPLSFVLGAGQMIPGFDEGVVGMKVGGERRLILPPALAYGAQGRPPKIPANAELTFDVQLVSVE